MSADWVMDGSIKDNRDFVGSRVISIVENMGTHVASRKTLQSETGVCFLEGEGVRPIRHQLL
jgi:hypothetical protein